LGLRESDARVLVCRCPGGYRVCKLIQDIQTKALDAVCRNPWCPPLPMSRTLAWFSLGSPAGREESSALSNSENTYEICTQVGYQNEVSGRVKYYFMRMGGILARVGARACHRKLLKL
jgi:hypothetical protein